MAKFISDSRYPRFVEAVEITADRNFGEPQDFPMPGKLTKSPIRHAIFQSP